MPELRRRQLSASKNFRHVGVDNLKREVLFVLEVVIERALWGVRGSQVIRFALRRNNPQPYRLPHQNSDALGLHLLHDLHAIALDRAC